MNGTLTGLELVYRLRSRSLSVLYVIMFTGTRSIFSRKVIILPFLSNKLSFERHSLCLRYGPSDPKYLVHWKLLKSRPEYCTHLNIK